MEKAFVEKVQNQIETANSFGSSRRDLDHIFCQQIGMSQSDRLNISHKKPSQSDISYFSLKSGSMFCQISPSQSDYFFLVEPAHPEFFKKETDWAGSNRSWTVFGIASAQHKFD